MANLLVRNLPQAVVASLKRRAAQHRRSLQQEVAGILEQAAREPTREDAVRVAQMIRARLARSGRRFSDSTPLIREDRER